MNFINLRVYGQSSKLFKKVFILVKSWDDFSKRSIGNQLIRSINSIHANLAEGNSKTIKDYLRFISISIGSCDESRSHILDAYNIELIDKKTFDDLNDELISIGKQLTNLKKSIKLKIVTSP